MIYLLEVWDSHNLAVLLHLQRVAIKSSHSATCCMISSHICLLESLFVGLFLFIRTDISASRVSDLLTFYKIICLNFLLVH